MLHLALMAAGRHKSAEPVLAISCKYQDLVHESVATSGRFVQTCLQTLNSHQIAMECFLNEDVEGGIEFFADFGGKAREMSALAKGLASRTDELKDLATEAMTTACSGVTATAEARAEAVKEAQRIKAESQLNTTKAKGLAEAMNAEQKKAHEAKEKAAEIRQDAKAVRYALQQEIDKKGE